MGLLDLGNLTEDTDYYTDYTDYYFFTEEVEILPNIDIFKICIYFVVLIMGLIGNGLVIFVTVYKMKTTVNSIWFLNLAIADFIYILFLVHDIIVTFKWMNWPLDNFTCKCVPFLTVLNMFASVFFLTVISMDRCLCTWVVVWAQNKRTIVKARLISVFVWLLSICCSIPFAIVYSVQERNVFEYCGFTNFLKRNALISLFTYRFMVGFIIPFFIIASSYIAIAVRVKRLKRGNHLRPFRVISVILAFFICWFPFHVQKLLYISSAENNWSYSVQQKYYINAAEPFVKCLAYLNSCLNPILYVFMCDEFKKKLKQSLLLVLEAAFTEEHLGLPGHQVPNRPTHGITISFSTCG